MLLSTTDASSVGSAVHLPPTPPEEEEEEEEEEVERVVGGVLVVEEFNWKTIATTVPLLRLATSGVKGATIKVNRRWVYKHWQALAGVAIFIG